MELSFVDRETVEITARIMEPCSASEQALVAAASLEQPRFLRGPGCVAVVDASEIVGPAADG